MPYEIGFGLPADQIAVGVHDRQRDEPAAAIRSADSFTVVVGSPCRRSWSLAERFGAEHGSVTDLYLPAWFARNMPALHVPLLLVAAVLHRRNLRRRRS